MQINIPLQKTFYITGLVLLFSNFSGCVPHTEKWREEVQLSDGRVIVVDRETIHERGSDEWVLNRNGTKPTIRIIRFSALDRSAKAIEWRSTKTGPSSWPEKPLSLDIEQGQPTVFSLVDADVCEIYSKYVYRNGLWTEEALPENFQTRFTNLFIRDGIDMPNFISLRDKKAGNAESGFRSALKQVGPARKVCSD